MRLLQSNDTVIHRETKFPNWWSPVTCHRDRAALMTKLHSNSIMSDLKQRMNGQELSPDNWSTYHAWHNRWLTGKGDEPMTFHIRCFKATCQTRPITASIVSRIVMLTRATTWIEQKVCNAWLLGHATTKQSQRVSQCVTVWLTEMRVQFHSLVRGHWSFMIQRSLEGARCQRG